MFIQKYMYITGHKQFQWIVILDITGLYMNVFKQYFLYNITCYVIKYIRFINGLKETKYTIIWINMIFIFINLLLYCVRL